MNKLLVISCLLLVSMDIHSQFIEGLNKERYQARVKLVSEFFARFNCQEKGTNVGLYDRVSNIKRLFDMNLFKSLDDPKFLAADTFAMRVVKDSITLHYTDSLWFAKVRCCGKLKGKPVKFSLYLNVEKRKENMYKWVIKDAEGSIFKTPRYKGDGQLFILPNDHEQFFMSLGRITGETYEYIDDYMRADFETDALSSFMTLVRYGLLKIEHAEDIEFTFLQVPGYLFTIKHVDRNDFKIERDSFNAGWLISSFYKCSDEEKINMMKQLNTQ